MADAWYMTRNGQQYGPYGFEQFKQFAAEGRLAPNDMVMNAAEQRWVAANTVAGLVFRDQPPAVHVASVVPGPTVAAFGVAPSRIAPQTAAEEKSPLDTAFGIAVVVSVIFWLFIGGPIFLTLAGSIWLIVGMRIAVTGGIPDTRGRLHRRSHYRGVGGVLVVLGLVMVVGHLWMLVR